MAKQYGRAGMLATLCVLAGLVMSIQGRASGPHIANFGFLGLVSDTNHYGSFNYIPNAAAVGADTVALPCALLENAAIYAATLASYHSQLASGVDITPYVIGLEIGGEEYFSNVNSTQNPPGICSEISSQPTLVQKNNRLRDLLNDRISQTTCSNCPFAGRKSIVTDLWWLEDASNPYYRPAPNADVLGIETYFFGDLSSCSAAVLNSWLYQDVGYRLHGVISSPSYSTRQFLVNAHAFRHPNQALFGLFPNACQIQWQYDLAIYLQPMFQNRIWAMNWFIGAPNLQHGADAVNLVEGIGHANNSTQLATLQAIIATNNANR